MENGLRFVCAALVAVLLLSACGQGRVERGGTGAAIGGAAGLGTGLLTGADATTTGLLGAAAGGAAGALTDEDDVDLGDPVWE